MTTTLTEFLLARIAEDEAAAHAVAPPLMPGDSFGDRFLSWESDHTLGDSAFVDRHDPARVLAECEAKRRIVELHKSWPVLVEQPSRFELVEDGDPAHYTLRTSQQIAWLTTQEYRAKFGDEPPSAPMLLALAAIYADHPDYQDEWRLTT